MTEKPLVNTFFAPLQALKKNMTAYDLLALNVAIMIFGHTCYYFINDIMWLRIPDRSLVCIWLIPVGYNLGRRPGKTMWFGAALLTASNYILFEKIDVNFLWTIMLVRVLTEPLITQLLKNKTLFWGVNILFLILSPITNVFFEYGTLAFIMAMAAWVRKNEAFIENKFIKPSEYFIFALFAHLIFTHVVFQFSYLETFLTSLGSAVTFWLLYDMRTLLLNSLRRRPKDVIEKFCYFLGHKSLEIYIVHVFAFQLIYYFLVMKH
ncbi:MAG: hypothetical protein KA099_07105 [Alphaproteobacteria bacterium]|jgi:hypothetical protein|nr:hypothetical protein [Alphaproteobacteria bacterium]MBK9586840.1 hypothetical protein [Alphaproteobacteria bacterium]MBP7759680.1 hypothetical protein [Alphaproteobacteria bacterium]MBP7762871.1 hypothetical protein [Alphaproteobacteria bacterium]MBP7905078.1 hypothetical protein [Alphaproteobacteria bacterium]